MNKVFLSLLLAVCVLGMVLIMLNERLRKPDQAPAPTNITEPAVPADMVPVPPSPVSKVEEMPVPDLVAPVRQSAQTPVSNSSGNIRPESPKPVLSTPTPLSQQSQPSAAAAQSSVVPPKQETMARPAVKTEVPKPVAKEPETPKPVAKQPTPPKPEIKKAEAPKPVAKQENPVQVAPEQSKEKAETPQQRNISKFVVFAREKGATVRLVGTAPIAFKSMELMDPYRLVVDLDGSWQIKAPGVPKNVVVTNVRLGKESKRTRIVIDLSQKVRWRCVPSADRTSLDIRLDQ
ncbi:MAG: AMIN domain-containing protein [Desulfovibrio sp.]|nr:AMIN domain-containing protein [Desulfovibrio sp.]